MTQIELLAPAKNAETGIAAINYGADAVYIGADRFGARAAATNSVADIESLINYAHKYAAKVYVTVNTLLYDNELELAEELIHNLYNAGADAVIIQDMGILKMNIPPIPLHASTQTNNFSQERIQFLDKLGFERIVLARELSVNEIRSIRNQTKAELEFFVHGSLCVSLSGQCYFSQAITGRSANRGECAQMCRHPYTLTDRNGKKIVVNSHLQSLKDLNLSGSLKELIDAGITSLKIEGRLKDINYVKNIVSYYRQRLDEIFETNRNYSKSSSGYTKTSFVPDPERSFSRSSTTYFLEGRPEVLINQHSPKSTGKMLGSIKSVINRCITIDTDEYIHNGDGLCFIVNNELCGIRVEKVEGKKIFVNNTDQLTPGTTIFRNYDHQFNKVLESDRSVRKISATIAVTEKKGELLFELTDEDSLSSAHVVDKLPVLAKGKEQAIQSMQVQLSKSAGSIFEIGNVSIECTKTYFFRISELNTIRNSLFVKHEASRASYFARKDSKIPGNKIQYPTNSADFSMNISNHRAEQFYKEHGVEHQEPALEVSSAKEDQLLMTTRYCIKYEMGLCERFQKAEKKYTEPLYLEDKHRKYLLEFNCNDCIMSIRTAKNNG